MSEVYDSETEEELTKAEANRRVAATGGDKLESICDISNDTANTRRQRASEFNN